MTSMLGPIEAAPTGRPVLLVHGFAGTKSCWFALTRALRAQGVTVDAIKYLPVTVDDVGHVGLLLSPQVFGRIVAALPIYEPAAA
jgi:pimeloyl-ACP methyl ester carboxylesterase